MSYQSPYQAPAPLYADPGLQRRQDEDQLNMLAICHHILGGLTMLGGLVFLIYIFLGGFIAIAGATGSNHSPSDAAGAQVVGGMFVLIGLICTLIFLVAGGLKVWAGRCLQGKHGYSFATFMACLECLHMPLGTVLGVCTLVVLSRPSVRALFQGETILPPPSDYNPPAGSDWYRRG